MARYSYKPRSLRKAEGKNKKKFFWSIIISTFLLFVIFKWGLPLLIENLQFSSGSLKQNDNLTEETTLAPPILNIPYEATNTAIIKIKGFSTGRSMVKIFLDDNLVSTTESDDDGVFTSDPIDLSLGTNNITGKTVDDKGKESLPSKNIQVFYSNDKPRLDLSEPKDGLEIKGGDKKVTVAGQTDPNNEVSINGTRVIVGSDGHFSSQVSINDGDNTIAIAATNSVGNTTSIERIVKYLP